MCSLALVETTKAKASTDSAGYVRTLSGWAERKMLQMPEITPVTVLCQGMFCKTIEGQDQTLLLLGDTTIHGFRAMCNCLAKKQQVSRQRIESLSVPRGGVNIAPAMRRSLMSRRRLPRYASWSANLIRSLQIELQGNPYARMRPATTSQGAK